MSTFVNETNQTSFVSLLEKLLEALSPRERDVLQRRHSLAKGSQRKETLETIGQDYKVTRERVRQIERDGVKKLKEKAAGAGVDQDLAAIEAAVRQFLKKYGGIMHEGHLMDQLADYFGISTNVTDTDEVLQHKKALSFIIAHLLADKFERVDESDNFHAAWKLKETPWELVEEVIDQLLQLINREGKPLTADQLFTLMKEHESYSRLTNSFGAAHANVNDMADLDEAVVSYLKTSRRIKQNLFGHIGLADWNTISPKRMNDKIYLVLKRAGKPLHFTAIADLINEAGFDHKKALPATIHNELILDDRYVLIGRGIYALREWGYEPGTVADVIAILLKETGPLTKEEIIAAVTKQRLVKKATINLALMDKERFVKTSDKRYAVAGVA